MKKLILALLFLAPMGYAVNLVKDVDVASNAGIQFSKLAALSSGKILAGNGSNVATAVTPAGEVTMDSSGSFGLSNASVIAKVITGFVSGAGTVGATDSILAAIQKLDGNIAAKLSTTLSSGKINVGNGSNVATAVTPGGSVTMDSTGAFVIGASKVTNSMLAGSIDLTSKVTNTLPLANGGTGQTSSTTAFDGLSPCTTQGDIMYYNGTHWVCLATGTSGNVLTTNGAAANPTWAASSSSTIRSSVRLRNPSGFGSTNTQVRTYTTIDENTGTEVVLTQSATLGDSLKANSDGLYCISCSDMRVSGAFESYVTKNSTSANPNTSAQLFVIGGSGGDPGGNGGCFILAANDVVRCTSAASNANTTGNEGGFSMTKVSP